MRAIPSPRVPVTFLAIVLAAVYAGQAPCAAGEGPASRRPAHLPHDVLVANESPLAVVELYAAPISASDWGPDRLQGRRIERGRSARIPLERARECFWDVAVTYADESTEEMRGLDLCHGEPARFDGAEATPSRNSLQGDAHALTLANQTTRTIVQLFVSPTAAQGWGDNRLDEGGVAPGGEIKLAYRGSCAADIRVVFDNAAAEERSGIDLCTNPALAIRPGWTTSDTITAPQPAEPSHEPLDEPAPGSRPRDPVL